MSESLPDTVQQPSCGGMQYNKGRGYATELGCGTCELNWKESL